MSTFVLFKHQNIMPMETEFKEINKEFVGELSFPNEDVLESDFEKNKRNLDLERAMALGNLDQIKVKIYFEDDMDKLFVETTVWAVTSENVILKQGLTIPNQRIFKIH